MNKYLSAILAGIALCASAAWADTVELPLTDDAFINGTKPDVSTGTWANIVVHNYGPKYGLVRFDAAAIAGQHVSSATLTLYLNSLAVNGTISVHAITSGWSEATVTWRNQPPAETMATAIVGLTTGDVGGVITVDVTGAVQRWSDGSLADAGFMIVTSEDIRAKFDAKEMAGGVAATLIVETGASVSDGGAIVLDFSDPDNCTIDEPGHYVLDRDWRFNWRDDCPSGATPEDPDGRRILISADYVTLDFRGFSIEDRDYAYGETIRITGRGVTLRNSSGNTGVDCDDRQGYAIVATQEASRLRLENMRNVDCVSIGGSWSTVVNSAIYHLNIVGDNAVVEYSNIIEDLSIPSASSVIYNTFGTDDIAAIIVSGDGNIINGNFITPGSGGGIHVKGAGNVVKDNVLASESGLGIEGSANVVDANLIVYSGISFYGTGNFFGNNRVDGSFSGTEGQIDWGGNVSF